MPFTDEELAIGVHDKLIVVALIVRKNVSFGPMLGGASHVMSLTTALVGPMPRALIAPIFIS